MGCFELTYEGCVPSKSATWSHMVLTCMYMTNHLRFLRCTSNYQRPMGFVKVVVARFPWWWSWFSCRYFSSGLETFKSSQSVLIWTISHTTSEMLGTDTYVHMSHECHVSFESKPWRDMMGVGARIVWWFLFIKVDADVFWWVEKKRLQNGATNCVTS